MEVFPVWKCNIYRTSGKILLIDDWDITDRSPISLWNVPVARNPRTDKTEPERVWPGCIRCISVDEGPFRHKALTEPFLASGKNQPFVIIARLAILSNNGNAAMSPTENNQAFYRL